MQFIILAYDAEDDQAQERRIAAREAHIKNISDHKAKGNMIMGAALLDDDGKMIGSSITVDFPDEAALEAWLEDEPYVTGDVWEEINVLPCQVAPSFADLLPKK